MKTFFEYVTTPGRPASRSPASRISPAIREQLVQGRAAGGQQRRRLVGVERPPVGGPAQRPPDARLGRAGLGAINHCPAYALTCG